MTFDAFNKVNKSKVQELKIKTNTKESLRWMEVLLENTQIPLKCPNYQGVFLSKNIDKRNYLITGTGRLLGFKVFVSYREILGQLDYANEVIYTEKISSEDGFTTIPFRGVFAMCKNIYQIIKENLSPKFVDVPFLGGLKSIILSAEPQEIINFYLPEIVLFGTGEDFRLFTATYMPDELPLPTPFTDQVQSEKPGFTIVSEEPSKAGYMDAMDKILHHLKTNYLKKIVFSRKCTIKPCAGFDRQHYINHLLDYYFQEYFYLFRQGEEASWIGVSPEVILKQKGRLAVTEPLAGTRKKTSDSTNYEAIRKELTTTPKDIAEHEHASRFMFDQLSSAKIGEVRVNTNRTLLETPYAFHIKSEIAINLNESASFFDFINAIYPPATIWGIPVEETEEILSKTEPFAREYYTGLYGYWTLDDIANIALVIRSAKLENETISVYAGGGIVESSNPEAEYDEAENKMRPMLAYFVDEKIL